MASRVNTAGHASKQLHTITNARCAPAATTLLRSPASPRRTHKLKAKHIKLTMHACNVRPLDLIQVCQPQAHIAPYVEAFALRPLCTKEEKSSGKDINKIILFCLSMSPRHVIASACKRATTRKY